MARHTSKEKPLNERQVRFAHEYTKDQHGTNAAIRAGYAPKGAAVEASRLLKNPNVALIIDKLMSESLAKVGITRERTLEHLGYIAYQDVRRLFRADGSMKRPDEWDDAMAAAISSVETDEKMLTDSTKQQEMDLGDGPDYLEKVITRKVKTVSKIAALALTTEILGMKRTINPADSGGLSITFVPSTGK